MTFLIILAVVIAIVAIVYIVRTNKLVKQLAELESYSSKKIEMLSQNCNKLEEDKTILANARDGWKSDYHTANDKINKLNDFIEAIKEKNLKLEAKIEEHTEFFSNIENKLPSRLYAENDKGEKVDFFRIKSNKEGVLAYVRRKNKSTKKYEEVLVTLKIRK